MEWSNIMSFGINEKNLALCSCWLNEFTYEKILFNLSIKMLQWQQVWIICENISVFQSPTRCRICPDWIWNNKICIFNQTTTIVKLASYSSLLQLHIYLIAYLSQDLIVYVCSFQFVGPRMSWNCEQNSETFRYINIY